MHQESCKGTECNALVHPIADLVSSAPEII